MEQRDWSGVRNGSEAKEARKGMEMASPLEPPEGTNLTTPSAQGN